MVEKRRVDLPDQPKEKGLQNVQYGMWKGGRMGQLGERSP